VGLGRDGILERCSLAKANSEIEEMMEFPEMFRQENADCAYRPKGWTS
jgi:hypothetical protein